MSKRLQVLLDPAELRDLQRVARAHRMTVAAWVRQTLRDARRRQPLGDADKKLQAVRRAARHAFPTADIDVMLGEIEGGYADRAPR
jgi:predicted 2-oxoglutarate/Fe(II)-dependent dioxygenase YbiX